MKRFVLLSLAMLLMVVMGIGLVAASPSTQDGRLPTLTPHPVENVEYELSTVGGEALTYTAPGASDNGITIGEITAVPAFPQGITYTIPVESENDIEAVTVFMRYDANTGVRVNTEYDPEAEAYVGRIWENGSGQPPWIHFRFYVRATDSEGNFAETEPFAMDYIDPTREWYRVETPHVIIYWFGSEDLDPDMIATDIATAMAETEAMRIAGFGNALSYKPIGVLFPTSESFAEMYGSGTTNSNVAGFTSTDLGMTVQTFRMPTDDWFERQAECIYLTPREERTLERRLRGAVTGTVPHEVTHLYQFENGGAVGPLWWSEGQAEFFSQAVGGAENRLFNLADIDPSLAPLSNPTAIGAQGFQADGCYALAYDVGPSFINWLLANYGGIETHLEIVNNYRAGGMDVYGAIEAATGRDFFDLENEWRAYTGFTLLEISDVDPAAALEDAPDAPYQPGDSVVLPGPLPVTLKDAPGARIGNAQCFAGTMVAILRVGSLDGQDWYEVDCSGLLGWLTIDELE